MQLALARHDAILRVAIDDHGGYVFSTSGDGLAAAFQAASAAVAAALRAQDLLGREAWPTSRPLQVRMGLHTGEAQWREGDYFGPALNRAARLMAAGGGGQVLCSAATAGLVEGEISLVDLGEHRLRDLDRPLRVFQLGAGRFAPIRALDALPGNLPLPASSFVGRSRELEEVSAALGSFRLVTLTGVGGVGKTRLALEAAAGLGEVFPEGMFVVELAPVGDPEAVPDVVAAALGVIQQQGLSVTQSLAAALEGRRRLLILDNCEHVLDAAAELVAEILAGSATVKVLATSREALRLTPEHVWPVPSLSVAGEKSEAVELFVERAQAVAPGFSIDASEDRAAVVEVCRRLDGIPLAVELAASRMASMSPSEVRDRLGDRFRLLSGVRRGLERHQTLRNAVQWSYDLLGAEERALLDRCSVFAGGFDLQAAVAVAANADELEVLDGLASLVRKSLLMAERVAAGTRYAMLETVRQFAEERLAASALSDQIRDRHAHHYRSMEAPVMRLWNGPDQQHAYEWLDRELANLRAAFQWAADHDDLDTGATVALLVAALSNLSGSSSEAVTWAEQLLPAAAQARHRLLLALYQAAAWCGFCGRPAEGVAYADAAGALYGDPAFEQNIYGIGANRASGVYVHADLDRWVAVCRDVLLRADDPLLTGRSLLAIALASTGQAHEALTLCEGLVPAAVATDNPYAHALALQALALAQAPSAPKSSIATFRECLDVSRQSGMRHLERGIYTGLARSEITVGDYRPALDHLADATVAYFDVGDFSSLTWPLALISAVLVSCELTEPAATLAGFATNPFTLATQPPFIAALEQLHQTLGDSDFHRLGQGGRSKPPHEIVAFALQAIEQARTILNQTDLRPTTE
jgi:predicted ATPase